MSDVIAPMVSRSKNTLPGFMVALLLGCEPPTASATTDSSLGEGALVVEGSADEDLDWSARFKIANAPAGDYFIFASTTKPTSLSALDTFDPARCADAGMCVVPGLGTYSARAKLDAAGPLDLGGGSPGDADTPHEFFTLARRGAAGLPTSAVAVTVSVERLQGGGGCSPVKDPLLHAEPLTAH